jgi:peptide/nickel transport system permease protein
MTASEIPILVPESVPQKSASPGQLVMRRFMKNTNARVGMIVVMLLLLTALLAPVVMPYNPRTDLALRDRLEAPSAEHYFGTDEHGRDVFRRVVHGAGISLRVGIFSVSFAFLIGSVIGLSAGFLGGWTDAISMRLMDVLLSIPSTLLAIGIVAARGPGLGNTMLAISVINIPVYARIARASTLALRELDYVSASRAVGANNLKLIFGHILPNSLSPLVVQGSLNIATAIIEAAALGFLGLGAQPPTPEWGAMLSSGYKYLTTGAWWVLLFPGLAIMLTVLSFNLVGDGLRDALDPRASKGSTL